MNKKQREIIVDAYEDYIRSGMSSDPVGGFSNMQYFFDKIKKTETKLYDEMNERYNEIPD